MPRQPPPGAKLDRRARTRWQRGEFNRHAARGREAEEPDEFARWLSIGYATAYRTAYGLLRNRTDAEDAVQEAFLRAWRFRAAVPSGDGVQPWLYRVVVNACLSKLRRDGRDLGDRRVDGRREHPAAGQDRPIGG